MHRTIATRFVLLLLLAVAGPVGAQDPAPAPAPAQARVPETRTGDARLDQLLGDIDRYGARYQGAFIDELVRYHAAPRDYVSGLLGEGGWKPGDVYYACALGGITGRSCRYVAEAHRRDPGAGWGPLAQRLGVAPGSAGADRLLAGIAASYQRWARPLPGVEAPAR
jgi:hypothetical protein